MAGEICRHYYNNGYCTKIQFVTVDAQIVKYGDGVIAA